jgi:phospholipid N-methyltransferase
MASGIVANDAGLFLRRFLQHPWRVGAVAPSSSILARHAVARVAQER